jgi:hypothetical protein
MGYECNKIVKIGLQVYISLDKKMKVMNMIFIGSQLSVYDLSFIMDTVYRTLSGGYQKL